MIGMMGFLEECSFAVVPVLLLALVLYFALHGHRGNGRPSVKGALAGFVLIMLPVVFGWKFVRECRGHWFLSHLRPDQVDSIVVDRKILADDVSKASIVHALNEVEWFAPHHGGWGEPVIFTIRLRSGEEQRLQIAFSRLETGVVLDLNPSGKLGGPHTGYVFSRPLVDVLKQSGVDLRR